MQGKTGIWKEVNFSDFCDSFSGSYKDNFSYNGKRALYDYLVQLSEEIGEIIELDTVALCSEYTEHDDVVECASNYFDFEGMTFDSEDGGELKTVEEVEAEARKYLQDRTTLIEFTGGIIIQDF